MAKELRLDVVATKQSKQLSQLADEMDKLAKENDNLGKGFQKTTSFSKVLDEELKNTKQRVVELQAEFKKTGSLDTSAQIGGLQKNIKALERIKKDLTTQIGGGGPGAESMLAKALQFGGPAAPIVAPAAGGLLLGALGVGVIGAGIVGQLQSPQVQAAFSRFKTDAGRTFTEATAPFGGVITRELSAADDLVQKVAPELTGMFQKAAPAGDALFKGVNGFVEQALPGLSKGLDGAVIVVDELGRDLPKVGKAIGDAFAGAAKGAQGDAQALHDLLTVTDQLITASGQLAGASGQMYEQLRAVVTLNNSDGQLSWKNLQKTFNAVTTGGIEPILEHLLHLGSDSKDASYQVDNLGKSLNDLGPAANTSANALRYLNGEIDTLIGQQLRVDQANDKFKEDLLDLKNQLDAHSRSIDQNSLAGLHNRDVILGMIADAEAARQAAIDHAGGVNASKEAIDKANASYQAAIDQLVGVASQAGISRDALNKLAGNYQINVLLAIDAIDKSGLAQNVSPHDPNRKGTHKAAGGPVKLGQKYVVNEYGVETFTPTQDGYITPAGGAKAADTSAPPFVVDAAGATGLEALFLSWLSSMSRAGKVRIYSKSVVN